MDGYPAGVATSLMALFGAVTLFAWLNAAPASADSKTLVALADSYVSSASPDSNQGGSTVLKVDGSPTVRSYLRFEVRLPPGATITDADLRLHTTTSNSSTGIAVSFVAQDFWFERAVTYENAPAMGARLGTSGSWSSTGYLDIPLTPGGIEVGWNTLALTTTSSGSKSFDSREGANVPELVVTYSLSGLAPAVPSTGAYFGAYVGDSTGRTLVETEALLGRRFAIAHDYRRWDHAPLIKPEHEGWAADGRLVFLNWKAKNRDGSAVPWAEIASGARDARIDAVAEEAKRFAKPLFIAFHHEPEDEVGSYGGAADFAAAYRRVVSRFQQAGADNVAWVWNVMGTSKYYELYGAGLYPGDDVVDWIAWDPYNWVDCNGRGGDWVEFADKVAGFYDWLEANDHADKPFMLGEYGSDEPLPGQPSKGDWFLGARDALSGATDGASRFPNLKALVYFDSDRTSEPSGCAWQVDSTSSALAGIRALGADPYLSPGGGG
jgi:hypothetical protein